jgi:hypothetical protein
MWRRKERGREGRGKKERGRERQQDRQSYSENMSETDLHVF